MNQLDQRPIIALDFSTWQEVEDFLLFFPEEEKLFVKIGMELFYQEGPEIVRYLKDAGHDVFLDLKLHDIPNTVEKAMRGLAKLGVDVTCVHDGGGNAWIRRRNARRWETSPTSSYHSTYLYK